MNQALKVIFGEVIKHQELAERTARDATLPTDVRLERVSKHAGAALALKQVAIILRGQMRASQ